MTLPQSANVDCVGMSLRKPKNLNQRQGSTNIE